MSVETLVSQLRSLVGDAAGDSQVFADAELQAALERTLEGVAVADAVDADYEINEAAADVCELWAMRLKDDVDFKDGAREFKDSQKREGLLVMAGRFRQRSSRGVGVGRLTDSDTNAEGWWP